MGAPVREKPGTSTPIDYSFKQRFRAPAAFAYRWATEFTPRDWAIGGITGRRKVVTIAENTILLLDTFPGDDGPPVRKTKLVHVYPETRTWVSTHIAGPRRHSQFRYCIREDGPASSILEFRGREIRREAYIMGRAASDSPPAVLRRADSQMWKLFALGMERDFKSAKTRDRRTTTPRTDPPGRW